MLPVFITNRLDSIILYMVYIIWLLPEVISSFTNRIGKKKRVDDRASGLAIGLSIWLAIFTGYWTADAVRSLAIPWHRTLLFAIGIFLSYWVWHFDGIPSECWENILRVRSLFSRGKRLSKMDRIA